MTNIFAAEENLIYTMEMPWWMLAVFATIPSIFGAMHFRVGLSHFTGRTKKETVEAYDEIFYGRRTSLLVKGMWFASFVFMLFLVVCLTVATPRFYGTYLMYTDEEATFFPQLCKYDYSEIDKVYYMEGRYNDDGDYIDRSSYVIQFKDGVMFDFDGWCSDSETAENIIGLIKPYCGEIVKVKSERDISEMTATDEND